MSAFEKNVLNFARRDDTNTCESVTIGYNCSKRFSFWL